MTQQEAIATLRLNRSAPGEARTLVRQWMGSHPRIEDAELAVSELITNALLHTDAEQVDVLYASTSDGGNRISVRYAGDPVSTVPQGDASSPSGRGLLIVQSVTDRWGVVADGRVSVWFEV